MVSKNESSLSSSSTSVSGLTRRAFEKAVLDENGHNVLVALTTNCNCTCFMSFVEVGTWFSSLNRMRGRARCCILSAFAFAFIIQLVVVFVYFPSSSINNGLLLDESAFPASPVMRVSSKPHAATNTTVFGALEPVQHAKVAFFRSMEPTQSGSIDALHREPIPSVVIPSATLKQALTSSELDHKYDLIIGINTVSRTGSPDYLMRTLRALRAAILDFRERRIFVLVACPVNCSSHSATHPSLHDTHDTVYSAARMEFDKDSFISFLSISPSQRFMDPTPLAADPDDHNNPDDRPGKRVRQQTGDVITLLRAMQESPSPPSSYLMMMEDDFLICDGALVEIFRFIDVANSRSQRWMGVRASYGLNGIVLNMHDAPLFESWLAKKIFWKPPDILYTEWVAGVEGKSLHIGGIRPYYTAQFNLFHHIGVVSSLRQTGMGTFPGCKADLSPVLWDCEKFKSNCKDLSPC